MGDSMGNRIDHVGVVVSDLERSVGFYARLGFQVERKMEFPGREIVILTSGGPDASKLELLRYAETDLSQTVPADRTLLGLRHLAIHVADVSATFERLGREGVRMLPDPPFQQAGGPPIAFGLDPDGVLLEFTEIV